MSKNNLYSNSTLEELIAKQSSLIKRKKASIIVTILLVLNTIFAIYTKNIGFIHSISILLALFFLAYNASEL